MFFDYQILCKLNINKNVLNEKNIICFCFRSIWFSG